MNDCIHFEDLCSAAIDGALTREEKKELDAHLKSCPACRAYYEDMRAMRTLWRGLDSPLPEGLHASILSAVRDEQALHAPAPAPEAEAAPEPPAEAPIPLRTKKRGVPMFGMLAAAAACVTLVLTGGLAGLGGMGSNSAAPSAASAASSAEGFAAVRAMPAAQDTADPQDAQMDSESEKLGGQAAAASAGGAEAAPQLEQFADNAAPMVELPASLSEHAFAAAYLAAGTGELPVIDEAVPLTEEDGRSYYSLPNDVSVIEKVIDALPAAGYTVTVANIAGAAPAADEEPVAEVLLIVTK